MGKEPKNKDGQYQPIHKRSKRAIRKDTTSSYSNDTTKCRFCNHDFLNFQNLHSHTCKPFKCSKCPEAFKHDYELSIHLKEHSDTAGRSSQNLPPSEGTFTCTVCNYICESLELLSEHKLTCRKKLQKCEVCGINIKISSNGKDKHCKKCSTLALNAQPVDYFLRRSSQPHNLSGPSTSRASGNQFHENIDALSPQDKSVVPCVRLEHINACEAPSGIQNEANNSSGFVCCETREVLNINLHDFSTNKKRKNKKLKQITHLKRNENTSSNSREKASISKIKRSSYRETINQSKCPNVKTITKKQLRRKSDTVETVTVKSRTSLNCHKKELLKKNITRSYHGKHLNVKNIKNSNQKSENKFAPVCTTEDHNIANIENIIHSLPDSQSGILLKSSNKANSCYKCVRCFKPLKLNTGGQHFSTCKAKYKKSSIPVNDIVWLCLLCHSSYSEISELLKHRKNCHLFTIKNNSPKKNWLYSLNNKNYSETFKYFCENCQFKCMAKDKFISHSCDTILKRRAASTPLFVKLGPVRKLDLEPSERCPYYECNVCTKTFLQRYECCYHIKQCHPSRNENDFTTQTLVVGSINRNFSAVGKVVVKQEKNVDVIENNLSSPNAANTESNDSTNIVTDSSVPNLNSSETLISDLHTDNLVDCLKNALNVSDQFYSVGQSKCECVYDESNKDPTLPKKIIKQCFKCQKKMLSSFIRTYISIVENSSFSQTKLDNQVQSKNQSEITSSVKSCQQSFVNNQPESISSLGSCQSFVNNQPRLFPTPPATPDSNICPSPKTQNVVPDSHISSCPPSTSGSTSSNQSLQNDSSFSKEYSNLNENECTSNEVNLTFENEIDNNQTDTPIFDIGSYSINELESILSHQRQQSLNENSTIYENRTSVQSPTLLQALNDLSNSDFKKHYASLKLSEDFLMFDNSITIPSNLNDKITEIEKGPFTLHYSYNSDGQNGDVLALIPSFDNISISKYICLHCYLTVNNIEDDICKHLYQVHSRSEGCINIFYFVVENNESC